MFTTLMMTSPNRSIPAEHWYAKHFDKLREPMLYVRLSSFQGYFWNTQYVNDWWMKAIIELEILRPLAIHAEPYGAAPSEVVAMSLIWPVTEVASGELMEVQRKMHMFSTNACDAENIKQLCTPTHHKFNHSRQTIPNQHVSPICHDYHDRHN